MDKIAIALCHWLEKHGISPDGVELRVTLPERHSAYQAERALHHELEPHLVVFDEKMRDGKTRIHGVVIEFNDPSRR